MICINGPSFPYSSMNVQFVFRVGLSEDIDCAVRFDQELTQTNKVVVLTDALGVCHTKASHLANMGLVTSIMLANQEQRPSEDEKELATSEDVCIARNLKLAR